MPQSHQPECQQAAQFGAALGGGHLVGWERIGATGGTGIEHHDPSVPHCAATCDLGTGQPACDSHGWNRFNPSSQAG